MDQELRYTPKSKHMAPRMDSQIPNSMKITVLRATVNLQKASKAPGSSIERMLRIFLQFQAKRVMRMKVTWTNFKVPEL